MSTASIAVASTVATAGTFKKIHPLWENFTYFSHQLEGIQWMLEKEKVGTTVSERTGNGTRTVYGGLQCDDMGLGKTIQITSVMVNNIQKATLLLAPLAMIETWTSVCRRAGMIVFEADSKGSAFPWRNVNQDGDSFPKRFCKMRPAIYITNYEKLYTNPSLFKGQWDRIVLDEAHKIRNGDGEIARSARKLDARIRWAVTGTPLVNSLKDVVSIMAFLGVPYSPLWRWEPRYLQILPQIVIHRSLDSLRAIIQGAPPVPEINEMVLPFLSEEEEEFYYGVQGATESMMKKYAGEMLSSSQAFTLLLRLRQISVHPQVYINAKRRESPSYYRKDWVAPSTKLNAVANIITSETDKMVHKYIVFCQFTEEIQIFREYLVAQNLVSAENVLVYDGSLTQDQRTAVLRKSKETTETTVLLLQLQAGGVGLNLQEYDRIVFVSPYWTSALMDQAIARAVRMGQTEVVRVYHLRLEAEMENAVNIDELVNAKAEEKRRMLVKLFRLCAKGEEVEEEEEEEEGEESESESDEE